MKEPYGEKLAKQSKRLNKFNLLLLYGGQAYMYYEKEAIEQAINKTYPSIAHYARDVNLGRFEDKYTKGIILREKAFVDASMKVGGMVTTHRFSILSNHMADFREYEHGTNWGLCVANKDSHFKVLDIFKHNGKTQIILLHLPDNSWEVFLDITINIDDELVEKVRESFKNKINMRLYEELTTDEWLQRCSFPIGINDEGVYFEL